MYRDHRLRACSPARGMCPSGNNLEDSQRELIAHTSAKTTRLAPVREIDNRKSTYFSQFVYCQGPATLIFNAFLKIKK